LYSTHLLVSQSPVTVELQVDREHHLICVLFISKDAHTNATSCRPFSLLPSQKSKILQVWNPLASSDLLAVSLDQRAVAVINASRVSARRRQRKIGTNVLDQLFPHHSLIHKCPAFRPGEYIDFYTFISLSSLFILFSRSLESFLQPFFHPRFWFSDPSFVLGQPRTAAQKETFFFPTLWQVFKHLYGQ